MIFLKPLFWSLTLLFSAGLFVACQPAASPTPLPVIPTLALAAVVPSSTPTPPGPPPTWTAVPDTEVYVVAMGEVERPTFTPRPTLPPTTTPLPIPTRTPVTPTLTPSITPTPSPDLGTPTVTPRPYYTYTTNEPLHIDAYPRPPFDNGWGIHWIPTVSQDRATVDTFVDQAKRMHIKWVVFLNDSTNIGDNDYLVERLVANGIMPIMRLYISAVVPYPDNLASMVLHYRLKGVYYFQLYNEPNVNIENTQGAANPNTYAKLWGQAARVVINQGGLPGLGALSPGGEYNHLLFLQRTLTALKFQGDEVVLNRTWISLHNYHGVRALDDLGGFLMFREYDRIVRESIGRSLPIIGTEGGSYSSNPKQVIDLVRYQYTYMREAEPYYFVTTYWLLANKAGGGHDNQWEWQALIQPGYTHPVVTEFFYKVSR